jgi:asparagine synthase (glutamine-hydrolysing)
MWRRPRKEPVDYMERSNALDYVPICEKWLLRNAFSETGLLPDDVLWRQKEAFSDGVSGATKSWYQEIQDRIPADSLSTTEYRHLAPISPESRYYRDIFNEFYGAKCEKVIPYFWMPKWSGETADPSARTLSIYTP